MTNYDGTTESSAAAWTKAKALKDEALAAAEKASKLLFEACNVFFKEERRHKVPSPGQHQVVRWEEIANMLENCAGALGGGDPNKIVTLVDNSFFEVGYVDLPKVSNIASM